MLGRIVTIAKGCTLDEANCFAEETIREIEFAKDYEVYQDERLRNLIIAGLTRLIVDNQPSHIEC
jgi:hypothetical protein